MKHRLLAHRLLNSRVNSENTTKTEKAFGYFLGPCLVYTMYTGVAGTYLTQFYTDVLGLAGAILTWMPLISKLLSAVLCFGIGKVIDHTRTAQGKARPWIFISGILLTLCGVLLYTVPKGSYGFQIAWVVVSYNLFFSIAFSLYSLSHSMMVPLSTRDTKQRDSLAMLTSTGTSMIPGMISTIVMPLMVTRIGVGTQAQGSWITVMGILSALAIPATLLEYYFTRERITEENSQKETPEILSLKKQAAVCVKDKYWVLVILFTLISHLCGNISTSSMLYYCNWVLGNSVEGGAVNQILVNMIGQAPMGFGVFILWPLVRRFGKQKVCVIGFSLAAAGALIVLLSGSNMVPVLTGLFIKSIGALPTYLTAALLAEALDHIEHQSGFRPDGFSASVNSITQPMAVGLSQTLLLAGIQILGYIVPESTSQMIVQPETIRHFFAVCFAGVPMVGYALCAVIMSLYTTGKPSISETL